MRGRNYFAVIAASSRSAIMIWSATDGCPWRALRVHARDPHGLGPGAVGDLGDISAKVSPAIRKTLAMGRVAFNPSMKAT